MGTNQIGKRFYQVKIKGLDVTSLKELGQLMGQLQRQAFRKTYDKIWDLAMIEVSTEAISSLDQYYDQLLRCFTFGDFQLSPMVEEFEEILGCPLGGRRPYLFSGFYPSLARISKIVQISAQELDHGKQVRNGVRRMSPVHRHSRTVDLQRSPFSKCGWVGGGFPNVPLIGTRGCFSYNPVLAIRQLGYPMRGAPLEEELAPVISRGFNKTNGETLQKVRKAWEVVQKKDKELRGSNNGPIGGYRSPRARFGLAPLPSLRTAKREEVEALEEDEEVQALRAELEQAQIVKERFKSTALKIRKENAELRDTNIATTKALEQETKRARREEHGWNKFQGALWGSNSELKLRREERDQSRVHGMVLKEELAACSRSKKSLAQHLEAPE
ncbi:hypothetical protein GmHk_11G032902 [Glycine max]|nr:hypothetical protein GmHk_11G032902 [Glycine max]